MQKMGVLFLVCSTLFFCAVPAQANNCAIKALAAAKAAGDNTTTLKQLFIIYFGEPFARHVAGAAWNRPNFDQAAHLERVQTVVLTLAKHLAPYADATFSWSGNIGRFVLITKHSTEHGVVQVYPSGTGCMMTDVCIMGKGCLSSYVPKTDMTAQK
jgi:hypothetical protein